jgi:hypothetical protein
VWDVIGAFILAKILYSERLEKAERKRRHQPFERNRPGFQERLRMSLADLLITTGMKLKARYQSDPAVLAFRHQNSSMKGKPHI